MIIVMMGVCGAGKTKVGKALAASLGWPFYDADAFHPPANKAKMGAGVPLTDEDRWPWLDAMTGEMRSVLEQGGHAVLACSALREVYRERLARAGDVRFVYLKGSFEAIAERLARRKHEYMPASLLPSQFAALEEPAGALVIDIGVELPAKIDAIRAAWGLEAGAPAR